jgi:hypothetical protein
VITLFLHNAYNYERIGKCTYNTGVEAHSNVSFEMTKWNDQGVPHIILSVLSPMYQWADEVMVKKPILGFM